MIPIAVLSNADVEELLGLPPGDLSSPTQSLIVTDSAAGDEPIIFANDAFSALTGYARVEIIGRNCRFLQGRDTNLTSVAAIREAIARRRPFHGDILNYRKNGTSFWNRLSLGPARLAPERYCVGLQMDVSDRYQEDDRPAPHELH
jgi:PAS domain S-box-containing protein